MDMIFIRQDGNFLGHEIIEELEKRGEKIFMVYLEI